MKQLDIHNPATGALITRGPTDDAGSVAAAEKIRLVLVGIF